MRDKYAYLTRSDILDRNRDMFNLY